MGSTVKPSQRTGASDAALLHRDLARQAVRESLVLLKNNDAVLPLAVPTTKKILVVGNGMDRLSVQSGGWTLSWQGADVTNADFLARLIKLDAFAKGALHTGFIVEHSAELAPLQQIWRRDEERSAVGFELDRSGIYGGFHCYARR